MSAAKVCKKKNNNKCKRKKMKGSDNENELEADKITEVDVVEENPSNLDDVKLTKPFLKWAGGKYKIIHEIKKLFPKRFKRYIEPFVGAGSVALNIDCDDIIINDINPDLTNLYSCLKKHGVSFIDDCEKLFIPENNTREKYKEFVNEFNRIKDAYRKSILFIYLNRHCFNGLCRYNGRGEFNTPIGNYETPYFPKEQLGNAIDKVSKFQIKNIDYRDLLKNAGDGDLVYCDPPYLPLSESASFNAYSSGGFSLHDQIDLARMSREAADRGATVLVSNHYNWYSHQIYKVMYDAKIKTLKVSRTISSKVEKRESVKELIAVFEK